MAPALSRPGSCRASPGAGTLLLPRRGLRVPGPLLRRPGTALPRRPDGLQEQLRRQLVPDRAGHQPTGGYVPERKPGECSCRPDGRLMGVLCNTLYYVVWLNWIVNAYHHTLLLSKNMVIFLYICFLRPLGSLRLIITSGARSAERSSCLNSGQISV